jgi:hypothetical protein
LTLIRAYVFWDPLRTDARYDDLLRSMKLAPSFSGAAAGGSERRRP